MRFLPLFHLKNRFRVAHFCQKKTRSTFFSSHQRFAGEDAVDKGVSHASIGGKCVRFLLSLLKRRSRPALEHSSILLCMLKGQSLGSSVEALGKNLEEMLTAICTLRSFLLMESNGLYGFAAKQNSVAIVYVERLS
ncbi:hypothetical protein TNCT_508161 [Trichonephila clavata]|uniref:Uncharacterized protein n=1 Tax=Trichonephila clavata TaxID=2740835 RepID=A0A8X6M0R9_TRICU|nr:hypothetical protein TNCT_508161 [Trichonephila clavata]